jgi:hypothetical protein
MAACQRCKVRTNNHLYLAHFVHDFFRSPSNLAYTRYCAQCGEMLERSTCKASLSCRHNLCALCAVHWINFCIYDDIYAKDFIGPDAQRLIWPTVSCLHCGQRVDITGLQLHDDHFISIPHAVRKFCFTQPPVLSCVQEGCTFNLKSAPFFDLLLKKLIERSVSLKENKPEVKSQFPQLGSNDLTQPIEDHPYLRLWLEARYCKLQKVDPSPKMALVGWQNLLAITKEELTTKWPDTKRFLAQCEEDFKEIKMPSDVFSKLLKEVRGLMIRDVAHLGHITKTSFMRASIFGHMYGYKVTDKLYYMCMEGMPFAELKKAEPNLDLLLGKVGACGRGIYLSPDPAVIHAISTAEDHVYKMAAVLIATPETSSPVYLNPYDERRTAAEHPKHLSKGPVQPPEEAKGGAMQDSNPDVWRQKNCMKKGNIIYTANMSTNWIVTFEPSVIIPIAAISYSIDFSK